MPKLRTIDEAFSCLAAADPDTALTKYALRRMVTTGVIPSVMMGRKYLVDLDSIELYLSGSWTTVADASSIGRIRSVGR